MVSQCFAVFRIASFCNLWFKSQALASFRKLSQAFASFRKLSQAFANGLSQGFSRAKIRVMVFRNGHFADGPVGRNSECVRKYCEQFPSRAASRVTRNVDSDILLTWRSRWKRRNSGLRLSRRNSSSNFPRPLGRARGRGPVYNQLSRAITNKPQAFQCSHERNFLLPGP